MKNRYSYSDYHGATLNGVVISDKIINSTINNTVNIGDSNQPNQEIILNEIDRLHNELGNSVPEISKALIEIKDAVQKKESSKIKECVKQLSDVAIKILSQFASATLKDFLGIK